MKTNHKKIILSLLVAVLIPSITLADKLREVISSKEIYAKVIIPEDGLYLDNNNIYTCNEIEDLNSINPWNGAPWPGKQYDPILSATAMCTKNDYVGADTYVVEYINYNDNNGDYNLDGTPMQLWEVKVYCWEEGLSDGSVSVAGPTQVNLLCLDHESFAH